MLNKRSGGTAGFLRLFVLYGLQPSAAALPWLFQASFSAVVNTQRRQRFVTAASDVASSSLCSSSTSSTYAWVWNDTENWCSLCREPLNTWNEHRGKRDHICLEMFYNALVHYGRQWTPATLWWEVEECTMLRRPSLSSSCNTLDIEQALAGEVYVDYVHAPTAGKSNLATLMEYYDRAEHYTRRLELYACIQYLIDNGVVRTDRAALSGGASFHGSLVTFKELFPNLVNMFPYADAKEISALTQMIASSYNSETVFDLCNFGMLVSRQMEQEVTATRGAISSSPGAAQSSNVGADTSAAEDYSYHWKGVFCRGVMGQLRWALEPESVECPLRSNDDKNSEAFGNRYLQVLAEHTCRALLAEMVFCRVSEYVVRVEGVWRQRGQEVGRRPTHVDSRSQDDALSQLSSNWGMLKYMDDHFYEASFGGHLPNDGAPKRKRMQTS